MLIKANSLCKDIFNQQINVGSVRLNRAIELFFDKHPHTKIEEAQVIIGDLGVAVEQILKAYINLENALLTIKAPSAAQKIIFLTDKEELFDRNFDVAKKEILEKGVDLIDYTSSVSLVSSILPTIDKNIIRKLDYLRMARNESIHSFLSKDNYKQIDKFVYVSLKVSKLIEIDTGEKIIGRGDLSISSIKIQSMIRNGLFDKFIKEFEKSESDNFFKLYYASKGKASSGINKNYKAVVFKNDQIPEICPICKSEGIAEGRFSIEDKTYNYGYKEESLFFIASSFECFNCGIKAFGLDELLIIGFNIKKFISTSIDLPVPPIFILNGTIFGH